MSTAQIIGPQLPVVRVEPYKRRTASTKLNWRRTKLEKAEYAPDNSRIGRAVETVRTYIPVNGPDIRLEIMNRIKHPGEYLKLAAGIVTIRPVVRVMMPAREEYPRVPFIGPREDAKLVRTLDTYGEVVVEKLVEQAKKQHSTAKERKSTWTPQQGQRPAVRRKA